MRKKFSLTYRVQLFDARGKFATASKALYYVIYYGKRQVVKKTAFPKKLKAAQKKELLEKTITKVERKRIKALEERRRLREKAKREVEEKARKREQARLRRNERARLRRAAEREKKRLATEAREIEREETRAAPILEQEREQRSKSRFEESKTRKSKVRGLVEITPVSSRSRKYKKEIIRKVVESKRYDGELINLKILDFTLANKLEVSRSNVDERAREAFILFKPHIKAFFTSTKGTERAFIFRVKFDLPLLGENGMLKQQSRGVSIYRILINGMPEKAGFEALLEHVLEGFASFRQKVVERYLGMAVSQDLSITGFTLENVEGKHKQKRKR